MTEFDEGIPQGNPNAWMIALGCGIFSLIFGLFGVIACQFAAPFALIAGAIKLVAGLLPSEWTFNNFVELSADFLGSFMYGILWATIFFVTLIGFYLLAFRRLEQADTVLGRHAPVEVREDPQRGLVDLPMDLREPLVRPLGRLGEVEVHVAVAEVTVEEHLRPVA